METYYEVLDKENKVIPVQVIPEELKKCDNWLLFHDFNGRIIFENYSRASLCLFERRRERMIDN